MAKRIVCFVLTALLLFALQITAFAVHNGDLDFDRKGSVSVTMRDSMTQETVKGGELTIYKVADVAIDNGNGGYAYTEEFKSCGQSLDDLESSALADELAAYVESQKLTGHTVVVGQNGIGKFESLELGLYLVVQDVTADGYYPMNPFVVTVPILEEEGFVYDVDATAKAEQLSTQAPTKEPTETPGPSDEPVGTTTEPPKSTEDTPKATKKPGTSSTSKPVEATKAPEKLAQTGQLNWPIPILIVAGLILFTTGWIMTSSDKRKHNNEA